MLYKNMYMMIVSQFDRFSFLFLLNKLIWFSLGKILKKVGIMFSNPENQENVPLVSVTTQNLFEY